MMMTQELKKPASIWKKRGTLLLVSGLIGMVLGFFTMTIMMQYLDVDALLDRLSAWQFFALLISLVSLAMGAISALMSFSKTMYAAERQSEEPIEEPEFTSAQANMRMGALGLLALAVQLLAFAWPNASDGQHVLRLSIVIGTVFVQLWLNWVLWKNQDELHRRVTLEGSAIALFAIWLIATIWAALAQFGYVAAVDSIGLVVTITLACFIPTVWLAVKRGLTK
jgi:hypothetical protein